MDINNIDINAAKLLDYEYANRYRVLPIKCENNHLWVATEEPDNLAVTAHLADITGMYIIPVFACAEEIRLAITQFLAPRALNTIETQFLVDARMDELAGNPHLLAEISSAPAVRFIDSVIEAGITNRVSDIHIEPHGNLLRTRCRVDGKLYTYSHVDISILPSVVSRLKIIGGMDISEKRRPQDGRFTMSLHGQKIEFRLSTLPTAFGEKAVIRLLYGQAARLSKSELGFFDDDLHELTELFYKPHGAIFMTGPTGSGKSTTLNSFMAELNRDGRNIVTVEDPVENPIMGINHVNVDRAAGYSFATMLRHILRQDPDVIMIGEIRDEETVRIAIQAALTGHVVLSTLHTNDAAGVIERLLDMGIEPYLAASALSGVVSQRLVRRICTDCITPALPTAHEADMLGIPENTEVFAGKGCTGCDGTGYRGRIAVYEYIVMTDDMRRQMSRAPYEFAEQLRKSSTFKKNALRHLRQGNTTIEEVVAMMGY